MVDDFQKRYESLQIPYPKDTLTASIEKQAVEQKAAYEKFVTDSKSRYENFNIHLHKTLAILLTKTPLCVSQLIHDFHWIL